MWEFQDGTKTSFSTQVHNDSNCTNQRKKWLVHLEPIWFMDKPRAFMDSQDSSQLKFGKNCHLPPNNIFCAYPRGLYQNRLNLKAFRIHS